MKNNLLPCPCFTIGYKGFINLSFAMVLIRFRKIIVKEKISIIQTFFEDSIFVAWLATRVMRKKPVLLSSRRDIGLGMHNQPWYHRLFGIALPFVNCQFNGIIANSEQIKLYVAHREKTPLNKIKVIYNGVEINAGCTIVPDIFREKSADIWIAIVASLTPVKRHDVLIDAIALLNKKKLTHNVCVLVLGDGPEKEKLNSLVRRKKLQNKIFFMGAVHNVSDYLQHCDIGILCSDREGLSNAILEYMANGLPVIATAVGGNTELVDERNGVLIPASNPKLLADTIQSIVFNKNKRRRMGAASKDIVMKCFSWQQSMDSLSNYYLSLAEIL